jgi:hypothetical protein
MVDYRKVLVKRGNTWKEIGFKHLHVGDNFRLFEPIGDEVANEKNEVIFYATSSPYYDVDLETWWIDTE